MKYYNRNKDLSNRLLLGIIIIVVGYIAMVLTSCSEDEPDLMVGEWIYDSSGSQTKIYANFRIAKSKSGYIVSDAEVNGAAFESNKFVDVSSGSFNRLDLVKSTTAVDAVVFFGGMLKGAEFEVDSVWYYNDSLTPIVYYNQVIKKN